MEDEIQIGDIVVLNEKWAGIPDEPRDWRRNVLEQREPQVVVDKVGRVLGLVPLKKQRGRVHQIPYYVLPAFVELIEST